MMLDLSIVIVTWNAQRYVQECLASIFQHAGQVREIIVVDNASTDGTPEWIAAQHPEVVLIRNVENLGFAKANNIGLAKASGKYLCLVNSDVIVSPGCFETMTAYMDEHPRIGLLGPVQLSPDGVVRRSTMRFPTLWNSFCRALALDSLTKNSRAFGGYLMKDFSHDTTCDVDVLNGWFWMVRRSALDDVGPLDETFYIYGEDIDWCRRFRQRRWRVVFFAGATAIHYGAASSAGAPLRFYIEMQRADLQYWRKYYGIVGAAEFFVLMLLHHSLRIAGYAAAYPLRVSSRRDSVFKVKRSVASLAWLGNLIVGRL